MMIQPIITRAFPCFSPETSMKTSRRKCDAWGNWEARGSQRRERESERPRKNDLDNICHRIFGNGHTWLLFVYSFFVGGQSIVNCDSKPPTLPAEDSPFPWMQFDPSRTDMGDHQATYELYLRPSQRFKLYCHANHRSLGLFLGSTYSEHTIDIHTQKQKCVRSCCFIMSHSRWSVEIVREYDQISMSFLYHILQVCKNKRLKSGFCPIWYLQNDKHITILKVALCNFGRKYYL